MKKIKSKPKYKTSLSVMIGVLCALFAFSLLFDIGYTETKSLNTSVVSTSEDGLPTQYDDVTYLRYWYPTLNETDRKIYEAIDSAVKKAGVMRQPEPIVFEGYHNDKFGHFEQQDKANALLWKYLDDHPEYYWLDYYGIKYRQVSEVDDTLVLNLGIKTYYDHQKFVRNTKELLKAAEGKSTDYDKALALHDAIIDHTRPGESANTKPINGTAYGAIANGVAVCDGYTRAYVYLLRLVGIQATRVVGDANGPHAWVMLRLDGKYYFTDVLWDDGADTMLRSYEYFQICYKDMHWEHKEDRPLPVEDELDVSHMYHGSAYIDYSKRPTEPEIDSNENIQKVCDKVYLTHDMQGNPVFEVRMYYYNFKYEFNDGWWDKVGDRVVDSLGIPGGKDQVRVELVGNNGDEHIVHIRPKNLDKLQGVTEWSHDSDSHWLQSNIDDTKVLQNKHRFNRQKYDGTHHWLECECGEKQGYAEHQFGEWEVNKEEGYKKTYEYRECSCGKVEYRDLEEYKPKPNPIPTPTPPPTPEPEYEIKFDSHKHWEENSITHDRVNEQPHNLVLHTDDYGHWYTCSECEYVSSKASHRYEQRYDDNGHWEVCVDCGYGTGYIPHYLIKHNDSTGHWYTCSECGYVSAKVVHNMTYEHNDSEHWMVCSDCGYESTREKHILVDHHDGTHHWKECECGYATAKTPNEGESIPADELKPATKPDNNIPNIPDETKPSESGGSVDNTTPNMPSEDIVPDQDKTSSDSEEKSNVVGIAVGTTVAVGASVGIGVVVFVVIRRRRKL